MNMEKQGYYLVDSYIDNDCLIALLKTTDIRAEYPFKIRITEGETETYYFKDIKAAYEMYASMAVSAHRNADCLKGIIIDEDSI